VIHGFSWDVVKIAIVAVLLLAFAAIGLGCLINPDWGMRHFGRSLMGGGELRKEWNRMGISIAGLAFSGFAFYMLYHLLLR